MNKEKIKHIPFNMVFSISSFFLPYFILCDFIKVGMEASIIISLYIYFKDVIQQSNNDYLDERIRKLETKN